MRKLAKIVAKAGILEPEMLAEFGRWGHKVEVKPEPTSLAELDAALEGALAEEDLVIMRVTDLEAIKSYTKTQRKAVLHVVTEEDIEADIDVFFGETAPGYVILPWNSESIGELMCNGKTYLLVEGKKFFFSNMQELYFGDTKAFMLCQVSSKEAADGGQ